MSRDNDRVDEINRVQLLARHERTVSRRAHERAVRSLAQPPVAHQYRTPVPCRYTPGRWVDHLDPPGAIGTDFDGCVI